MMVSWRLHMTLFHTYPPWWASQAVLVVKNLPANARDKRALRSIPESGRSPGGGYGNPLQYSCLENPMDRGAWRAAVHMVTKSQTWLKQLSTHARIPLDSSLVVDSPSVFSLGGTYFFPLKDPGIMKLWPALFCFFFFPLALFPLSSVSLQTGMHIKLSVCFIVNQTVLTSFKICSFFILPYPFFNI